MSDSLDLARVRLRSAKEAFSQAAAAALKAEPGASEKATAALRRVNEAMREVRELETAQRTRG